MKKFFDCEFVTLAAVLTVTLLSGCASLENKAVGIGSGVDAFKLETSGSVSSSVTG